MQETVKSKFLTCLRNLTSRMKAKEKGASARTKSTSTGGGASNSTEDPHSEGTTQDTQKEEFKLRRALVTNNKKLSTTDILNSVPSYKVLANVRLLGCQHASEQFHYIKSYSAYLKYPNTRENLMGKGHFLGAPINRVFVGKRRIFV